MHRVLAVFILCSAVFNMNAAQSDSSAIAKFYSKQNTLVTFFDSLVQLRNVDQKLELNEAILTSLEECIRIPISINNSFDTIQYLGKTCSEDEAICIYTYNIPLDFGEQAYFGFLQIYDKENDTLFVHKLTDKSSSIQFLEQRELDPDNWFGSLCYKIHTQKYKGETHYILFYFDFNNVLTSKKIIDVLTITNPEKPVFGKPIIRYEGKLLHRVVFEYSARATMGLTYNDDVKMITFDHLSPYQPSLEGNYQFYGPDLSYDGLKFEKGFWIHQEKIDVRNLP
jgi:hypothetical protein